MITLQDCMWMYELIRSHQAWNGGTDWFLGSPRYGVAEYWLPDHEVSMTRSLVQIENAPPRLIRLQISHVDLLLEAQWSMGRHYYGISDHDKEHVIWVGDPWLFKEWLTEFHMLNSLTANPITL